jgi:hypothetical protein
MQTQIAVADKADLTSADERWAAWVTRGAEPWQRSCPTTKEHDMSHSRAVFRIDHRDAHVLQFDGKSWTSHTIVRQSDRSASPLRGVADREYFSDVCDALIGINEILVTGPHTTQAEFRDYVRSHRPSVEDRIVGWETVDHPTELQLMALARSYFQERDRLAGATPER